MDLFRCDLEILIAINGVGDGEPVQCPPVIWLHAWRCQTLMQCCRVACSRRCWFLWWATEPRNCPVDVDIIPVTRSSGLVFLIATKQNLRNTGCGGASRELIFSFCVDQDDVRRSWKTKFDSVQPRVNVRSTRILFLKADCDGSAWIDPFTRDPCDYSHAEWWFAEFETLQFDSCGILLRHFDRWNGNCRWSVISTRIVEIQSKFTFRC